MFELLLLFHKRLSRNWCDWSSCWNPGAIAPSKIIIILDKIQKTLFDRITLNIFHGEEHFQLLSPDTHTHTDTGSRQRLCDAVCSDKERSPRGFELGSEVTL